MQCPECRAESLPGKRFCADCGARLPHPSNDAGRRGGAGQPDELRLLTVAFFDLVGYTELSIRTDPESLAEVLRRFQECCADAARSHGGHVAQFLGDGVLIYFGFPVAHEDDASRALRCALEVQGAMAAFGPGGAAYPAARVGVHSGRVYISAQEAGGHREVLAVGNVPNIAARITQHAEPGTVLASGATWHLARGGFVGRDAGATAFKGVDEAVRVWHVLGVTPRLHSELAAARKVPTLGREADLHWLSEGWRDTLAGGRMKTLMLSGAPGLGKTRIIEAFGVVAAQAGAAHPLIIRCSERASSSEFLPLIEGVREMIAGHPRDPAATGRGGLLPLLEQAGLAPGDAANLITEWLLPRPGVDDEAGSVSPGLSAHRRRSKTMKALSELLMGLARSRRGLLLLVEDLHWADPSTLTWLAGLVQSRPNSPLLTVCTARPEFRAPWQNAPGVEQRWLAPLDRQASGALLRAVANGKSLPPDITHELLERADGVPLYLEEMTRALLETGRLVEREHTWEAVSGNATLVLPGSIESAMTARFDQLGPARATLSLAAVLGRDMPLALLEATSDVPKSELDDHISLLMRIGLVESVNPKAGERALSFRHALIREIAYEAIPRRTRRGLHAKVLDILVSQFAEHVAARPEFLAQHMRGAGDLQGAAQHLRQAGENAAGRGALDESIMHLEAAVECLRGLPPDRETAEAELGIQLALAPLYTARSWTTTAVDATCDRILALCQGRPNPQAALVAHWARWGNQFSQGRIRQCFDAVKALDALAQAEDSTPVHAVIAAQSEAATAFVSGDLQRSMAAVLRGLASGAEAVDGYLASQYQLSPLASLRVAACCSHYLMGDSDEAEAESRRVMDLIASLAPYPVAQAYAACVHLTYQFACGGLDSWSARHPEEVDRLIEIVLRVCDEEGLGMWASFTRIAQARVDVLRGRTEGRADIVAEQIRQLDAAGVRLWFVSFLRFYGELRFREGETERGIAILDDALAEARRSGQQLGVEQVQRTRQLLLHGG